MSQARPDEDTARPIAPTVFVSDASAEAERASQALRAEGYLVVDVPLSMLVARVAVQHPKVIVIDVDADGAVEAVARVRELPDADDVDVLFVGRGGPGLGGAAYALAHEASGFFERPIDLEALARKVDALTGGARPGLRRPTTPPPSLSSSRPPAHGPGMLPPPSMRAPGDAQRSPFATPRPPPHVPTPPIDVGPVSMRRAGALQAPLSHELEVLLEDAEQRIGVQMPHDSVVPSPEEEIEAVLPAELLAVLDEPIDEDDDDDFGMEPAPPARAAQVASAGGSGPVAEPREVSVAIPTPRGTSPSPPAVGTAVPPAPKTHGGGERGTHSGTHAGSQVGAQTSGGRGATTSSVERRDLVHRAAAPPAAPASVAAVASVAPAGVRRPTPAPATMGASPDRPPRASDPPLGVPSVLGVGDAPRALARAIAKRASGVLAIETRGAGAGVRRAVLREGDLVTAASTLDDESLLAFLAARGELPRDRAEHLAGRLPPFGRYAGAALVAHGYLPQDQLWGVLRAHAEWVLARAVSVTAGIATLEADPPARLRTEPSVFGGSTGAEVFVEVIRRAIEPDEALARLGGEGAKIAEGANAALLSECALNAVELTWVQRALGASLGSLLAGAADADLVAVLYALSLLGVIEPIARPFAGKAEAPAAAPNDALDDEAIRAKVRARMQLVEEGDYFALLGVPRDATGYEVKRAFLDLRRAFEPSRLLTPSLADLAKDVETIATVLDEAYAILKDSARRERYRRAIEAV